MKKLLICKTIILLIFSFSNSAWAWSPTPNTSDKQNAQVSSAIQPPPAKQALVQNGIQAMAAAPVYAECNYNNFGSETGSTLVNHVKSVDPTCLYDLFTASSVSSNALSHANMTTIINAARTAAVNYQGTNTEGVEQLILFIRAGYYQASNNTVPNYTSSHKSLVQAFINDFEGNSHFYNNTTEEHGQSLYEFMTMLTNVDEEARGLPIAKNLINNFNQTRAESFEQSASVNQALNVLFYGFNDDAYKQAVTNDNSIVDALFLFLRDKDWTVGTNREYLYNNMGGELGRFLGIPGTKSLAKARIKSILPALSQYSPPWLKIAAQIDYFTPSECGEYTNVCNYKPAAIASILPIDHTCSSTLKMKVQEMTSAQRSSSCNILSVQETYFHNKLNTGNTPISGDLNEDLLMVIFNSSTDYKNYGNPLFGIDTNNGGMYIEGDPTHADNQATFYAHEAEWLLPEFKVWNLEHEYVHYLDGRFNLAGGFSAPTVKVVWWAEGLAEYISLKDNNQAALDTISDGSTYTLQQILETTYDGFDVDRIYRWGYLAVRFMFEAHPNEVTSFLNASRAGNWNSIQTYYNQWSSSYGNEFTQWTQNLSSGGSSSGGSSSGGSSSGGSSSGGSSSGGSSSGGLSNGQTVTGLSASQGNFTQAYYIDVPSGASNLAISISGGSGDADLYVKKGSEPTSSSYDCRPYAGGNNETCGSGGTSLPTSAGRFYIKLNAYSTFSGVSLTASYSGGGSSSGGSSSGGSSSGGSSSGGSSSGGSSGGGIANACASEGPHSGNAVTAGDALCAPNGSNSNSIQYFYILVPANTSTMSIRTEHGSGNGNLYYNASTWATSSNNNQSSTNSGNTESITVSNPSNGYRFISIVGQQSGMTLLVELQ